MSLTPLLRTALALGLALTASACADLTEPGNGAPPAAPSPAPSPAPAAADPAAAAAPTPAPTPAPVEEEQVGASHVLVQYQGSSRANPTIKRTKEEAQKLAAEIAGKAKKGQDFTALAKQYSDEPGAKERGGSLGKFTKGQMVKPFADAAFALKPGEVSGVVETNFGFHVIKRTE